MPPAHQPTTSEKEERRRWSPGAIGTTSRTVTVRPRCLSAAMTCVASSLARRARTTGNQQQVGGAGSGEDERAVHLTTADPVQSSGLVGHPERVHRLTGQQRELVEGVVGDLRRGGRHGQGNAVRDGGPERADAREDERCLQNQHPEEQA